ncbi:MAG: NAD(P)H-dependent glycerol-3-phosphate dehydrogenase [Endomicrobiia bacterium]|nr:NAD(P)H-dependent glycerol-3-phosphate dehydrogenase [Endomicrobiia bacterium]
MKDTVTKDTVRKISVLGAGTWGATLAAHLASKKYDVVLWEFDKDAAAKLSSSRTLKNLKGFTLPASVRVTSRLADVFPTDLMVSALPSFAFESTLKAAVATMKSSAFRAAKRPGLVIATKGFVGKKGAASSSAMAKRIFASRRVASLSGPSHAEDVTRRVPTAVVAASKSKAFAATTQRVFFTENFRVYANSDVAGCETAGALKNIYAIAAGIADGLNLGDNAKAALVTRSLSEMSRAGVAMGGKRETFAGLAGVGDLIVTCYSLHSRNRRLGEMVGRGLSLKKALSEMTMVAEGVYAARAIESLKKKFNLDTPIADEVRAILFGGKDPRKAVSSLMTRPLKPES